MSEALMLTQIKTLLDGVAGIGATHAYQRALVEPVDFATVFKNSGVVDVWMIHLEAMTPEQLTNNEEVLKYTWMIRGYFELIDASDTETTFKATIAAVQAAFRGQYTLSGTAERAFPMVLETHSYKTIQETKLCHYVELSIEAQERVQV